MILMSGFWPVTGIERVTFGSAPAALSACGSQGIVFHSTPVSCSPWLCVWGYSPFAPPSSPMPPSAGHNVGRSSVPVYKHSIANAKSRLCFCHYLKSQNSRCPCNNTEDSQVIYYEYSILLIMMELILWYSQGSGICPVFLKHSHPKKF